MSTSTSFFSQVKQQAANVAEKVLGKQGAERMMSKVAHLGVKGWLGAAVLVILAAGSVTAMVAVALPQDTRQQASGGDKACIEKNGKGWHFSKNEGRCVPDQKNTDGCELDKDCKGGGTHCNKATKKCVANGPTATPVPRPGTDPTAAPRVTTCTKASGPGTCTTSLGQSGYCAVTSKTGELDCVLDEEPTPASRPSTCRQAGGANQCPGGTCKEQPGSGGQWWVCVYPSAAPTTTPAKKPTKCTKETGPGTCTTSLGKSGYCAVTSKTGELDCVPDEEPEPTTQPIVSCDGTTKTLGKKCDKNNPLYTCDTNGRCGGNKAASTPTPTVKVFVSCDGTTKTLGKNCDKNNPLYTCDNNGKCSGTKVVPTPTSSSGIGRAPSPTSSRGSVAKPTPTPKLVSCWQGTRWSKSCFSCQLGWAEGQDCGSSGQGTCINKTCVEKSITAGATTPVPTKATALSAIAKPTGLKPTVTVTPVPTTASSKDVLLALRDGKAKITPPVEPVTKTGTAREDVDSPIGVPTSTSLNCPDGYDDTPNGCVRRDLSTGPTLAPGIGKPTGVPSLPDVDALPTPAPKAKPANVFANLIYYSPVGFPLALAKFFKLF